MPVNGASPMSLYSSAKAGQKKSNKSKSVNYKQETCRTPATPNPKPQNRNSLILAASCLLK
jgi:hypothetical protein